jgi:pre-rRNA-processing protein TSR1
MEGEQTWPTEEELAEAEERVRALGKQKKVKVPKGTSSYQAAWIIHSDDEQGSSEEEMDDMEEEEDDDDVQDSASEEEYEHIDLHEETESVEDENEFDDQEEERQYQEYLESKKKLIKESQEDLEFPDEVDTPIDIPARVRFQKYRGLKSFRTSPWDPYENLPLDYSRIFQFKNFARTRKRVLDTIEEENDHEEQDSSLVSSGKYVAIYLSPISHLQFTQLAQRYSNLGEDLASRRPIVLFSLLQHENKMSVVHFSVTRPSVSAIAEQVAVAAAKHSDMTSLLSSQSAQVDAQSVSISLDQFTLPPSFIVKSKDPLLLCCGFRRYIVRPIYSSHTRGGSNHVHKFERFLQPGRTSVATVYAPIQFAPCPITLWRVPGLEENMTGFQPDTGKSSYTLSPCSGNTPDDWNGLCIGCGSYPYFG